MQRRRIRTVYIPKLNNPKPAAKERQLRFDACHHCKEVGPLGIGTVSEYLAELQKKRKQVGSASSSGIFTIELFSFPNNNSWVYDTGCGTNICITKQGFRIERKLKQGALYLYVGNGVRAQVEAIGSFDLVLPNGLVICLDNCHYAPTITRGVVSVSRLVDNGFVQCFTDYGISVSKNGVLYFNVVPRNGIYEIDMHDLVPNVNYLQQDGLLKSTDDESFDKCESCLSGKMTKKPFPHSNDKAKDLIESATAFFNMVPTKKVDKTPYELWYGKSSILCLTLKIWEMDVLKQFFLNGYLDEDIYMVATCRPDVAFAQNMTTISQNPGEPHWTAVKTLLMELEGAPCKVPLHSSATESEYIAASEAAMEAVWIRKFI
ncbi:hypothetical protein Tco_0296039 [Tanacetum coccineum]